MGAMNRGTGDGPDRIRWNARYGEGFLPSFEPHPLAELALSAGMPAGPVLDLACGTSGNVLLAAGAGRNAVGVDVSDQALRLLRAEVARRRITDRIRLVQADLRTWRPAPAAFALVSCTGYWDRDLFPSAAMAVLAGGLLAWEGLTIDALKARPGMPVEWCLQAGERRCCLMAGTCLFRRRFPPEHGDGCSPGGRPRRPRPARPRRRAGQHQTGI